MKKMARSTFILVKKLFNIAGLDLHSKSKIQWNCWPNNRNAVVHYEDDNKFHYAYDAAQQATQMSHSDNPLRRIRHYTLMQIFDSVDLKQGAVAECGTFHGLSAYQIANKMKSNCGVLPLPHSFYIFDSFEGLSAIETIDKGANRDISDNELR